MRTVFLKRSGGDARTLNMNQLMVRAVGNFATVDGYRLFWDKWQGGCGLLHLFSGLIDGFRAFGACKWVALGREIAMEALSYIVLKRPTGEVLKKIGKLFSGSLFLNSPIIPFILVYCFINITINIYYQYLNKMQNDAGSILFKDYTVEISEVTQLKLVILGEKYISNEPEFIQRFSSQSCLSEVNVRDLTVTKKR